MSNDQIKVDLFTQECDCSSLSARHSGCTITPRQQSVLVISSRAALQKCGMSRTAALEVQLNKLKEEAAQLTFVGNSDVNTQSCIGIFLNISFSKSPDDLNPDHFSFI